MSFEFAAISDIGSRRTVNQDSLAFCQSEDGKASLAIICDGLGGLTGGQLASMTVVAAFVDWFKARGSSLRNLQIVHQEWRELIDLINRKIVEQSQAEGLRTGTTLTAAFILNLDVGRQMLLAHIGDTRVYVLREQQTQQITKDQTEAQRDIEAGFLKPEDAMSDKRSGRLLQCIGVRLEIDPQIQVFNLRSNDRLLFTTDGFYHHLSPEKISAKLAKTALANLDLAEAVLQGIAEENKELGETDNLSALIVEVS